MIIKRLFAYTALSCILTTTAYADISVKNNTNTLFTAKTKTSQCSGDFESGKIRPNSTLPIPQFVLGLLCGFGCEAYVFASDNCSGPRIATAKIDSTRGIKSITNHGVNGIVLSGGGFSASIDQTKEKEEKSWLDKFLHLVS